MTATTISPSAIGVDQFGITLTAPTPYNPGFPILMKELGGRYDLNFSVWRFPKVRWIYNWLREELPNLEVLESCSRLDVLPSVELNTEGTRYDDLYPYQKDAVHFIADRQSGLLALSPGLGKTAVSLVTAHALGFESVIIVCPLTLIPTWVKECEKWTGRELQVSYGHLPEDPKGWYVTNYDTIANKKYVLPFLRNFRLDVMILDESVLIKNRNTVRAKTLMEIRPAMKRVWLLSGSPITRYYDDLWSQFRMISPSGFTAYGRFIDRFCITERNPWTPAPQVKGSRTDRDIQDDFSDVMFVRHQKDVLPDLPDFIYDTIEVELGVEQRRVYDEMKKALRAKLEAGEIVSVNSKLAQLIRLQQITSNLANLEESAGQDVSAKADVIEDLVKANEIQYPAIIWVHWTAGARALQKRLEALKVQAMYIDGETPTGTREFWKEKFQAGELPVMILSLGVGKFGLTLTAAKDIIYHDKTMSADDYIQSLHRVKRIGLDHAPRVLSLKAVRTVDVAVEKNLTGKMPSIASVSNADLMELLEGL